MDLTDATMNVTTITVPPAKPPHTDSIGSASTMGLTVDSWSPIIATIEARQPNIESTTPQQQQQPQQHRVSVVKFADHIMNMDEVIQRSDTDDTPEHRNADKTIRDNTDTQEGSSSTLSTRDNSTVSKITTTTTTTITTTSSTATKFQSKQLRGNLTRRQNNRNPYTYYEVINVLGLGSMGSVAMVRKRPSAIGGSARKRNITSSSTNTHTATNNNSINSTPTNSKSSHDDNGDDKNNDTPRLDPCFQFPMIGPVVLWFHDTFRKTDGIMITSDNDGNNNSNNSNNDYMGVYDDDPSADDDTVSTPKIITTSSSSKSLSNFYPNNNNNNTRSSDSNNSHNSYDMTYAMKSIHISRCTDPTFVEELQNEIQILKTLDHPHIEKVIETFEYEAQIFVILELCYGGDLYQRDPYTEDEAARITSSILSAISYMHSNNVYVTLKIMWMCGWCCVDSFDWLVVLSGFCSTFIGDALTNARFDFFCI